MNINSEFERLRRLIKTPKGFEQVEAAWNLVIGAEQDSGIWIKRRDSYGYRVVGFAIDPVTKEAIIDSDPMDHRRVYNQLVDSIRRQESLSIDDAEDRIIAGWAGRIMDFSFPCIFLAHWRFGQKDRKGIAFAEKLEREILRQEIGLLLNGLFMRHRIT
jgi:hypothetical protein